MAAILTSTGIAFPDGTSLTSKYDVIPQSTVGVFFQASAPTGWTQNTSYNDRALRVVSGTGGGFGGATVFSSIFPNTARSVSVGFSAIVPVSGTVGGHTLSVTEIPDHTHDSLTGGTASAASGASTFRLSGTNATGGVISPTGLGQSHDHPFSGEINFTTTGTGTINMNLQYIDVIICSFN